MSAPALLSLGRHGILGGAFGAGFQRRIHRSIGVTGGQFIFRLRSRTTRLLDLLALLACDFLLPLGLPDTVLAWPSRGFSALTPAPGALRIFQSPMRNASCGPKRQ